MSKEAQMWNDRYATDDFAYGREPNTFLREQAHRIQRGRVLCLAEGEGRNAVFLATLGHSVTAVDFSAEGLRKAERLAREQNVEIETVQADLATYEPDVDAFAAVISIFAHVPPHVRAAVHRKVPLVLRRGGVFILEAYTPAQIALGTGGPRDPALLMTLSGLKEELSTLTLDVGQEVLRDIHEGTLHHGRSATVQFVASRQS